MKGTIWCLHGAVGMAEDWRGFSVPGWAVKRVDLWRFLDCCPMSMEEFGEALNREVEATKGVNVLLGYSMGGRLALHALLAGGPWAAAVIVSAHPGLEDEGEKVLRREKDAEWGAKALSGNWREFLEEWNGQAVLGGGANVQYPTRNDQFPRVLGMEARESLVQRRQAVARSFMDWTLGGQETLWGRLGEIECPLLWCVGERDAKFRSIGERVAGPSGGNPSASLWVADGAGHRVPWEVPEAFAKKVGEFLEQAVS
ncbi:alpha/beta fold hydrolase [Haloferula sp.]|uniref:alpha/beta fold hydrolase n=1 Tax=Haloferula sp. TaxID=2497595 RepID=UPI003C74116D